MSDELVLSNVVTETETSAGFEPFHFRGAIPAGLIETNDPLAVVLRERVVKDLSAYQVFNILDLQAADAEHDVKENDLRADMTMMAAWRGLDVPPMADSLAPRHLWCKDGH